MVWGVETVSFAHGRTTAFMKSYEVMSYLHIKAVTILALSTVGRCLQVSTPRKGATDNRQLLDKGQCCFLRIVAPGRLNMFQEMTLHLCPYKQQQLELVSYLQTKEERTDIVLTRGCKVENWIWGKDQEVLEAVQMIKIYHIHE